MSVNVRSFAKINIGLRIGAAQTDGFHQLLTVYQTIGLHDVIRISVERGEGIEIRCDDPRVPKDESNTCFRIVEKAMRTLRAKGRVIIEIEKRLPVQGGLGGASANAVSSLIGLERALKKSLPAEERLRIAGEVGSDLPLFLIGGTVLGMGRGELVYPLEDLPAVACVVVTPEVGISTPKAFASWDRLHGGGAPLDKLSASSARRDFRALGDKMAKTKKPATLGSDSTGKNLHLHTMKSDHTDSRASRQKLTACDASDRMNELGRALSAWLSLPYTGAPLRVRRRGRAENPLLELVRAGIENDFERVVFPEYPEVREGKRALELAGAYYASLSGSGSALYGLFASRAAAEKAATRLRKQGWPATATFTLTRQTYWKRIAS